MAEDFSQSAGPKIAGAPDNLNGTYDRTVFSDAAADIIRNHSQAAPDQPLYMYIAFVCFVWEGTIG